MGRAVDPQVDGRAGLASNVAYGLVERASLERGVVDFDQPVARDDARACGWGSVQRTQHRDVAVHHSHFEADAAEVTAGFLFEGLQAILVEEPRVTIKTPDHAADSIVD